LQQPKDKIDQTSNVFPREILDKNGRKNNIFAVYNRKIIEKDALKVFSKTNHAIVVSEMDEIYYQLLRKGFTQTPYSPEEKEERSLFGNLVFHRFFLDSVDELNEVPIFFPILLFHYMKDKKDLNKDSNWEIHPFFTRLYELILNVFSRESDSGKRCEVFHAHFELLFKDCFRHTTLRSFFSHLERSTSDCPTIPLKTYFRGFSFIHDPNELENNPEGIEVLLGEGKFIEEPIIWLDDHTLNDRCIFHPTNQQNTWDLVVVEKFQQQVANSVADEEQEGKKEQRGH